MPAIVRIYFDLLNNIILYLLVCAIIKNHTGIVPSKKMNIAVVLLSALYAIPKVIPYNSFVVLLLDLGLFIAIANKQLRKIPRMYFTYIFLTSFGTLAIVIIHFLLFDDRLLTSSNPFYAYCKETICDALLYYIYEMIINSKKMRQMHKHFHHLFNVIILSVAMTLSYLTLYIFKTQKLDTPIIPMLFSALFLFIAACIEIYKRFIGILEENMQIQIQLEKSKLTAEYSEAINKRLKELHSLRHDMRNHFLTIDGYASMKQSDSIHQYISQITEKL